MKSYEEFLLAIVDAIINDVADEDALVAHIHKVKDYYGFDGFSYFYYHSARQRTFSVDTRPDELKIKYNKCGGIYVDPVANLTASKSGVFRWSTALANIEISPEQYALMALGRDYNINDGISASLVDPAGTIDALNFYTSDAQLNAEVYQAAARHINIILAAISVKYKVILSAFINDDLPVLSPREKQIMEWVARGKSSADIAIILKVSPKTVDAHISHSVEKLDATNRTNAAAKAVTFGLIKI